MCVVLCYSASHLSFMCCTLTQHPTPILYVLGSDTAPHTYVLLCVVLWYNTSYLSFMCCTLIQHPTPILYVLCSDTALHTYVLLELRIIQNYLFDLIHSYFFYNNTIQYNSVQFMIVFVLFPFGQGDSH